MCKYLTLEVMLHKNYRKQLFNLTYLACRFKKYGNDSNGYNINSNNNDNNNNNNNDNNHITDNKNKNIDNSNIDFCNS